MTLHFRNPRWLPILGVFQPKLYFYPNIFNTINLIELFFNDKQGLTLRTVLLSGTSKNCTGTSKVLWGLVLGQA